jgi:hypothetical protein
MPGILDHVARTATQAKYDFFCPTNPDEFFALQLARRLNEGGAAQHYADLMRHHSVEQLMTAFRRASARGSHQDPARSFHDELQRLGNRDLDETQDRRLAAVRVDRRAVAVVILCGIHLEYPPLVRQLPSDSNKAQNSAAGFISKVMQKCPFSTAALESLPCTAEVQRHALIDIIRDVLSEQAVGIWQVEKIDLLAAFGHPPLQHRTGVRRIVEAIWPGINGSVGSALVKDALALGLYCQTEYLFNI